MVLPRPSAFRMPLATRFARPTRIIRTAEQQPWQCAFQNTVRRGYASAGHGAKKASSDLPWLLSGIAITIPSTWYILQPSPSSGHGHDEGHGHDASHGEEKHEEKEEQPEASEKEEPASEEKPKEGGKSDESAKDSEKPDDSKPTDKPAVAKPAKSSNEMSGKQEGFTNTDTGHSEMGDKMLDASKKGEGSIESAKQKGTVSPDRPQAESDQRGNEVQDKSK
ncbi:hypothetical protein AOQ84DRAFT_438173 [Glonium stellatum]|uniref:Uncharacterized protein n=1 Tax=Glonium stellatum TaxID=574774 RepID=A0A8E2F5H1_9PEZI|nr:hypothetical protein AOQ84DRAFT_438173 [Glonium stellatum]